MRGFFSMRVLRDAAAIIDAVTIGSRAAGRARGTFIEHSTDDHRAQ